MAAWKLGQDAGFGEDVHVRAKVAAGGRLVAVQRGEGLNDLRAAAMAVHIAEAADVHENVKAQSGSGVEGAQGFVVPAAMAQAQLDDFVDAGFGERGDQVANLAVGVVAGRVKQRRGQLDFQGLGALDQIDDRRGGDGMLGEDLDGGLGQFGAGLRSRSRWAARI